MGSRVSQRPASALARANHSRRNNEKLPNSFHGVSFLFAGGGMSGCGGGVNGEFGTLASHNDCKTGVNRDFPNKTKVAAKLMLRILEVFVVIMAFGCP